MTIPRLPGPAFALGLLCVLYGSPAALATDSTWTAGASGNWVDAPNWSAGVPGATSGTASPDVVSIAPTNNGTITVDAYRNVLSILFTAATTPTLTGGTFYLGAGGVISRETVAGTSTGTSTINSNIVLLGDYTFQNLNTTKTLRFGFAGSPTIVGTAAASATQTLTLDGVSTSLLNSITSGIGDGTGGGNLALTKKGTGTWLLNGANGYTGLTYVKEGTLVIGKRESLYGGSLASWTAANIKVDSSATLGFQVGGSSNITQTDVSTVLGLNSLAAGSRVSLDTTGGDFTLSGAPSNANAIGLVKTGANTLILASDTSFNGASTIASNGGNLRLSSSNAIGATGTVAILSPTSGSVTGTLEFAGNINAVFATITMDSGQTRAISDSDAAHLANFSDNNSFTGAINCAASSLLIESKAGKLTLNGTITSGNATGTTGSTKPIYLYGAGDGEITSQILNGNASRPTGIIKQGTGTWILSNTGAGASRNNFDGTVTVSEGTLVINTDNTLSTGITTVSGGFLRGNGTVGAEIVLNAGGTVGPGSGADGSLNGTALTWNGGGLLEYNLGSNTSLLALSGTLNEGTAGVFQFNFTTDGGFGLGQYTLMTFASTTFDGSEFTRSGLAPEIEGNFQILNGSSLVYNVTAIPEPGALLLLGVSALGSTIRFRRRQAA